MFSSRGQYELGRKQKAVSEEEGFSPLQTETVENVSHELE